jgi:hypothetical protein
LRLICGTRPLCDLEFVAAPGTGPPVSLQMSSKQMN